jgi:hypothetical protein
MRWIGGFIIGATVAGGAAIVAVELRPTPAPAPRSEVGTQVAPVRLHSVRESLVLGRRGVAVAEAGAALGWRLDERSTSVEQTAGDVFYRVEPGRPFAVSTAVGEVRVTGTCFRVEVIKMQPIKQGMLGAALGAAFATAVVVTVYEGNVVVAGNTGSVEVRAGEQARLALGQPLVASAKVDASMASPELPPLAANASREELLVRDRVLREQVATLSERIRGFEAAGVARPPGPTDQRPSSFDPSHEQLLAFVKECRVQLDYPPVMEGEPFQLGPKVAAAVGLSGAEVTIANQALAELRDDWGRRMRGLYVEATGDTQGAESLSVQAIAQELQDKASADEPNELRRRIAEERAGLVPAPRDLSKASAFERYFRALANLGDDTEHLLAAKLGDEKAHALRSEGGGWPMQMNMGGCPESRSPPIR